MADPIQLLLLNSSLDSNCDLTSGRHILVDCDSQTGSRHTSTMDSFLSLLCLSQYRQSQHKYTNGFHIIVTACLQTTEAVFISVDFSV